MSIVHDTTPFFAKQRLQLQLADNSPECTVLNSLDPYTDPPRVASGWTVTFSWPWWSCSDTDSEDTCRLLVQLWIHGKFLLVADPRIYITHSVIPGCGVTPVLEIPILDSGVEGWQFPGRWARLESIEMYHQPVVAWTITASWGY